MFVSWYVRSNCKLVGCRTSQLRTKATGEKGPATESEPVTYALTQSLSHVSYKTVTLLHLLSFLMVTEAYTAGTCVVDGSELSGTTSMLYEPTTLRWIV